jgi:hypothetical protein
LVAAQAVWEARQGAERVGPDTALQPVGGNPVALGGGQDQGGDGQRARPGGELQRGLRRQDALEEGRQILAVRERGPALADRLGRSVVGVEPQQRGAIQRHVQRSQAARQILARGLVDRLGRGIGQLLGDLPGADEVAEGTGAAHVGRQARQRADVR